MEKRVALSAGSERWWEGLNPEVLALIFSRMPADVLLRSAPFVCRSCREALAGPACWAEIDIEKWCRRVNNSKLTNATVRKLVRRACGTHHRLSAYRLGDDGFPSAVCSGKFLKVLQIPMSEVTDQMVERHTSSLSNLNVLDISYCLNISPKGIEAFGRHCKSLVHLRRNMPPPLVGDGAAAKIEEGEAFAVANTMPRLEHLELAYARFSDQGLDAILKNCRSLCSLDIRGCWNVKMEGDIGRKCESIRSLIDSLEDDYDEVDSSASEESEDNSDESEDNSDDHQPEIIDVYSSDSDWSDDG